MPKKSYAVNPKLSEFVIDGHNTPFCWDYIDKLAHVVILKYFRKYLEHFSSDDLQSMAVSDAAAFIIRVASQNTDDDIKSIRNVLFTRIRNTISNFVFRSNKLINTEDDILDKQVVYSNPFATSTGNVDIKDLTIDSINSFRTISLKTWKLFKSNGATNKYTITNDNEDSLDEWKAYSEVKNMKSPCELIDCYNKFTDDQVEELATKLDNACGQNYFNTLYQLLGNKFLAFLDIFQEDHFNIPSAAFVKHMLTDISICEDYENGLTDEELSAKYKKSLSSVKKIIEHKDII